MVGARWWRCTGQGRVVDAVVVEGEGRPRWRWWKGKGWVRCAVVVEGAGAEWLEVGDNPDM